MIWTVQNHFGPLKGHGIRYNSQSNLDKNRLNLPWIQPYTIIESNTARQKYVLQDFSSCIWTYVTLFWMYKKLAYCLNLGQYVQTFQNDYKWHVMTIWRKVSQKKAKLHRVYLVHLMWTTNFTKHEFLFIYFLSILTSQKFSIKVKIHQKSQ